MKNRGRITFDVAFISMLVCIVIVTAVLAVVKKCNEPLASDVLTIENTKWAWDESVRQVCFNNFLYFVKGADDNILAPVFDDDNRLPKRCADELPKGTKLPCAQHNIYGTDTIWDCNTPTAQLGSLRCPTRESVCTVAITKNAVLEVSVDGVSWITPALHKCPDTLLSSNCIPYAFKFARLELTSAVPSTTRLTSCILYGYREDLGVLNRIRLDENNRALDDLRKFKSIAVGTVEYGPDFENLGIMVMFERSEAAEKQTP
jgi:hypothetical protein